MLCTQRCAPARCASLRSTSHDQRHQHHPCQTIVSSDVDDVLDIEYSEAPQSGGQHDRDRGSPADGAADGSGRGRARSSVWRMRSRLRSWRFTTRPSVFHSRSAVPAAMVERPDPRAARNIILVIRILAGPRCSSVSVLAHPRWPVPPHCSSPQSSAQPCSPPRCPRAGRPGSLRHHW